MTILSAYSAHTAHPPEAVFARWADPASWPEWDTEVRSVSFDGPPILGARGRIRPAHGPATSFRVTAYEQDRVFTNATSVPGASLTFEHIVTPAMEGSTVTVEVRIDGSLAPLWRRVVGPGMADAARSSVTGLIAHLDTA